MRITDQEIDMKLVVLRRHLKAAMAKHGATANASNLETLGDVTEEYHELVDAVRGNVEDEIYAELMDVAVAAVWGAIMIRDVRDD